jgi:CRP/FNR family cyclic AMP-dependent transcriptional regulator
MTAYESLIPTFPLFEGFTAHGAQRLIEHGQINPLPAGATVFKEGEAASVVLLVLAGELQVFVHRGEKDVVLASATPGTIVGELAVLCGIPRAASVRAAVDSAVLEWSATAFRRLLLGDVLLSQRIFGQALRTLIEKERSLIDSLTKDRGASV